MISIAFRLLTPDAGRSALLEVDLGPQAQAGAERSTVLSSDGTESTLFARQTGRVSVDLTGEVMLTLRSEEGARGRYELVVHQIDTLTEGSIRSVAPNDSVLSEAIDIPGDVDEFSLSLAQDDTVNVALLIGTPLPATPNELLVARLRVLDDAGRMISRTHDGGQLAAATGPMPLSASRYRLELRRYPSTPERHGGQLVAGTSVVNEAIDIPGDVDDFVLRGPAGAEVTILLDATQFVPSLAMRLLDAATYNVLATRSSFAGPGVFPRVVMRSTGTRLLRVAEARFSSSTGPDFRLQGGYRLDTYVTDRRPESRVPTMAIGDTIDTERLDTPGDIDEFIFAGIAGQTLAGLIDLPRGAREAGLILEILPLGGGPVLASVLANDLPSTLGRTRTPDFVLPVTGNYLVRVRDAVDWRPATDAHRFAIVQR